MTTKLTYINKETGYVIIKQFDTPLVEMVERIKGVVTRENELVEIEAGRWMWDLATAFHIFEETTPAVSPSRADIARMKFAQSFAQ